MAVRRTSPIHRRTQFVGDLPDGTKVFSLYSLSREGKKTKHVVTVNLNLDECTCSCESFTFKPGRDKFRPSRKCYCKHIERIVQRLTTTKQQGDLKSYVNQ